MPIQQSTHGFDSLAYMGSGYSPVVSYFQPKDPEPKDNQGIPLGTIWINTVTKDAFMLVAKLYDPLLKKTTATWSTISFGSGFVSTIFTDVGVAFPDVGQISILGGSNINTEAPNIPGIDSHIVINLDNIISLPATDAADTEGSIYIGGFRVMHAYPGTNPVINNIFLGANSGNLTLTASASNTAVGTSSLQGLTTGSLNSVLGSGAGSAITSGSNNVALGDAALSSIFSGSYNVAVGHESALNYAGAESSNVCISNGGIFGESHVIRLGTDGTGNGQQDKCYIAGTTHIARNLNLKVSDGLGLEGYIYTDDGGAPSRFISNPGVLNVFIGESSGSFIPTFGAAQGNVGVGAGVFSVIHSASGNVSIGNDAGAAIVDNISNVLVGKNAGNALAAGDLNTLVGSFCGAVLNGNAGTIGNTALGSSALSQLVTGSANLCLGGFAGSNLTTNESNNVLIANNGVVGASREIRIGTQYTGGVGDGQQDKCWIAGIRGVTTTVADAIPVLIDSTGQLGTVSSSARVKDDIEDMCGESSAIMDLRPVTFTYKTDLTKRMQYGLIAEEVAEIFPKLVVYDQDGEPETIRYHELPVLLLNELQKCVRTIEDLQERLDKLDGGIQKKKKKKR